MTVATWEDTWMDVARTVARRSSCTRAQVGAVIVDTSQRIVATGYNGPPRGFPIRCNDGCPRATGERTQSYSNCISIHAELNALMYSDRSRREGGTIYVTRTPCWDCAKAIANSGLKSVRFQVTEDDKHLDPEKVIDFLFDSELLVFPGN